MLYIDEFCVSSLDLMDYTEGGCYCIDRRSIRVIDLDDLVSEVVQGTKIYEAIKLGLTFANNMSNTNGRLYLVGLSGSLECRSTKAPLYVECGDYIIVYSRYNLYIGFSNNRYIGLHIKHDLDEKCTRVFIDGENNYLRGSDNCLALGFPCFCGKSSNKLVVHAVCENRLMGLQEVQYTLSSLKKYGRYCDNLKEFLYSKYIELKRQALLGG